MTAATPSKSKATTPKKAPGGNTSPNKPATGKKK